MKLPNTEQAFVDIVKLRDYCLNPDHPRGKHKARVFLSALGLTTANAAILQKALQDGVLSQDATPPVATDLEGATLSTSPSNTSAGER